MLTYHLLSRPRSRRQTKTELKRLWAEIDFRNVASQRMLEKSGFTREGLIRQGKMVNTWCDYYVYGILDSDLS